MRIGFRLCLGAFLCAPLLGLACNTSPEPTPNPGSWLILLCRTSDLTSVTPQPPSFYSALTARGGALWNYFDEISNHKADISGSRVRGWFDMGVTSAQIAPAVRNNTTNPNRSQTLNDCKAAAVAGLAAAGTTVDPANYVGTIAVVNAPADVGAAGGKGVVIGPHFEVQLGFVEHEMLHVYGLGHSWTMSADAGPDHIFSGTTDREYNDCWDIMSFQTCVFSFGGANGLDGPGLQAFYREKLGWLDATRVLAPGPISINRSVTLASLSDPTVTTGFHLVRLEVPYGDYVIDFREPTGLDQNFGRAAVYIREVRTALKRTYLVTRNNGDSQWFQGDVFTDTRNFLRISVDNISPGQATITVNTGFNPTGALAQLNQVCGDKFTGQTIPCAAMLTCAPRKTGVLVSVDYFCLAP